MNIQQHYNNVHLFNDIAGQLDNVTTESVSLQLSLIFEELTEAIDALEQGDNLELLDATCDIFVTVVGLMHKLEKAGFDVDGALELVNQNNLSKFSGSIGNMPENAVTATLSTKHPVYVFRNKDGKVCKPVGFVPVDLRGLENPNFLYSNSEEVV